MIKYGDIEYFSLLNLQDKLKAWSYTNLDLQYLDKLRMEIDIKIKAIHEEHNVRIRATSTRGYVEAQKGDIIL